MASPRAVRIPIAGPPAPEAPPAPLPSAPTSGAEWRPNRAGTQRAIRLSLFYVVLLAAIYALFVALERTSPGGTSSGGMDGIYAFTAVAAVLAAGGTLFALTVAPRGIEVGPAATVVVGRWGRRQSFPPPGRLELREVRHYEPGLLSQEGVVAVELARERGRPRTFLLEKGLLSPLRAAGSN